MYNHSGIVDPSIMHYFNTVLKEGRSENNTVYNYFIDAKIPSPIFEQHYGNLKNLFKVYFAQYCLCVCILFKNCLQKKM